MFTNTLFINLNTSLFKKNCNLNKYKYFFGIDNFIHLYVKAYSLI